MSLSTTWRVASLSTAQRAELIRTGLDYCQAESLARALGLEWDQELVAGLRILEDETLALDAAERRRRR